MKMLKIFSYCGKFVRCLTSREGHEEFTSLCHGLMFY